MTFDQMGLAEPILRSLLAEGYTNPTPIQEKAIVPVMEQRDLLGCAQTGTGKTAAFALPVLHNLYIRKQAQAAGNTQPEALHQGGNGRHNGGRQHAGPSKPNPIKVLVLTPTRELAIQVDESFRVYGCFTGMRTAVIFGGVSQYSQEQALRRGADIVVATPGRLMDLINQRIISLAHIETFILDEADRMLDMGFIHDIKRIIPMLPKERQTLFFSATMPAEIRSLADSLLKDPVKVEVAPVSSTAETINQEVLFVEKPDKRELLYHILQDKAIHRVLVFTRTKHGADKVTRDLNRQGIKAEAIHGNKAQNARQRALEGFKAGRLRVLVATDIAARGIDVDNISHVINFELPNEPETYVHRIGRTGRAGALGKALSFCDTDEREYLRDIQKLIRKPIPVQGDHPYVSSLAVPMHLLTNEAPVRKPANPNSGGNSPARSRTGQGNNSGGGNAGAKGRSGFWRNRNFQERKGN